MALSNKLGKSYEQVKAVANLKTITVDLGDVKFNLRVRVPLKAEMEEMTARIISPKEERVEKIFERFAAPIKKTIEEGGEDFLKAINEGKETIKIVGDDLIIDGKSVRQVANFAAIEETRVEEYFHLLVSETGDAITETYDEITAEFPEFAVKVILETIEGAIRPDYKTVKKN
jgi:hypothetical protein